MHFPQPTPFEKPCADRCGRTINERNAWPIEDGKKHICTACRYKRNRLLPSPVKP